MPKIYQKIKEQAPTNAVDPSTAVAFLKKHARQSFDETVELHIRLGVNPKKSDQIVRGSVVLPSGAPKSKRIAVFTNDAKLQAAAQEAGASVVGGDDLIKQIQESGNLAADVAVATPDMMPKIARIARVLGPQGLMPNPKTGTVSPNPAGIVKELVGGRLSFKMDQLGNIHEAVGKLSWAEDKIIANVEAIIDAVRHARPTAMKGQLLKSVTLASTMSPGIRISVS